MRDRSTVLGLWRVLCTVTLLALSSVPAFAASDWTVAQVRGTAFSLVGSKWEEMARGQEIPDEQVIRTLPSGRVQLDGAAGRLDLAGGTAIQLGSSRIIQFSGSLTVKTSGGGSLTIAADKIVANVRGTATLRFNGSDVSIEVAGGTVRVAGASQGETLNLVAGQSLDTSDTAEAAKASATSEAARSANAAGGNTNANAAAGSNANAGSGNNSGNSDPGGNSNAGGNGNSNAGGNGNGNSGGNSGGGNGNSGGGNGNSGGDGGNSGGNGNSGENGNSGNGGNGNGNGNGNNGG